MEKQKKKVKMNLKMFIFVLIIIAVALGITIFCLNIYLRNKPQESEQLSNETTSGETISDDGIIELNSDYGKAIAEYLDKVWVMPEVYKECIGEFDNIKNAPEDYLVSCAGMNVMQDVTVDIYEAKVTIDEFNNKLVELFGTEVGNNIVTEENLKNLFFVDKNDDGTYAFSGFCGSEVSSTNHIINEIIKKENLFKVELYEYQTSAEKIYLELNPGEQTYEKIYDRRGNLITTITVKAEKDFDANVTSFVTYDENGSKIDDVEKFLVSNYSDKLSVRTIELKYNEVANRFIMISNKLSGIANNSSVDESKSNENEEKVFNEGIYSYVNREITDDEEKMPTLDFKTVIEFKNNNIKINTSSFNIYGTYEKLDNNIIRCNIIEDALTHEGEEINKTDLRDKNIYIEFEIIGNNKLIAKECNYNEETELSICLNNLFANENEYALFDSNNIVGEWNSKIVFENQDGEFWKSELRYVFGSVISMAGSSITFNADGTFKDYVDPVNEGDIYRNGTYTFLGNSINLIYEDDNTSNNVEIYMLDENTLLYITEYYQVILKK